VNRLQNKIAIVTGAASGIGQASADLFAAEGARVLAVDQPGAAFAFNAKAIQTFACDVTTLDAPARIIGQAIDRFGGLDVLFNNAGIGAAAPIADMDDGLWDRVNDVNLKAIFRLSRAAIPHLVKSGAGRIVNTASVMAEGADYGLAAYSASKAGVVGLTRVLALELGKHGITANAILPGAIHTGMTDASFANPDIAAVWARKSPLKRLGQPIDVARLALFLASEESGFVTGQAIAADGGMRLRL